jgi:hypothetical protein
MDENDQQRPISLRSERASPRRGTARRRAPQQPRDEDQDAAHLQRALRVDAEPRQDVREDRREVEHLDRAAEHDDGDRRDLAGPDRSPGGTRLLAARRPRHAPVNERSAAEQDSPAQHERAADTEP